MATRLSWHSLPKVTKVTDRRKTQLHEITKVNKLCIILPDPELQNFSQKLMLKHILPIFLWVGTLRIIIACFVKSTINNLVCRYIEFLSVRALCIVLPWACTVRHYRFVNNGKWTDLIVSYFLLTKTNKLAWTKKQTILLQCPYIKNL